jgi:hypothetical protein
MAATLVQAGSQTCTLNTDHTLGGGLTGPAGGAHYALVLDVTNIVGEERLFAFWRREVDVGEGLLEQERLLVASGPTHSLPLVEVGLLRLPDGVQGEFGIRQEGGTGRVIPWAIERVDG